MTDTSYLSLALPRWRAAWHSTTWTRRATWLLFSALAVFVYFAYNDYGISNDEPVQRAYGEYLLSFYLSGFADQSAFHYKNLYLYGGMFDLISAVIDRYTSMDSWDVRHLLSGLFGIAGIAGAFTLAKRLANEKAGIVAALLLTLCGAWAGGMFTHTKDVPFATAMIWALYYTTRVVQALPQPPLRLVLKLGIMIGCAIGLRVGGVFDVMYLFASIALAAFWTNENRKIFIWRSTRALMPALLVAFALTALFWPWAVMNATNLINAAKTFSHFSFDMKTILDGKVMRIGDVPGTYMPAYLMVRLPELFLFGLAAALWFGVRALRQWISNHAAIDKQEVLAYMPLVLAFAFPIVFALITAPALYNGIRHFMFVLPPAAVLAALGLRALWHATWRFNNNNGYAPLALIAFCGALASWHITTLVRLHPYEYVYYNDIFAGGLEEAQHKWEMDYWSDSLREAALMLRERVSTEHKHRTTPYLVAICAESVQGEYYLGPAFKATKDWLSADFFLSSTQMGCDKALKGTRMATVSRFGVPLAVVLDRRGYSSAQRRLMH